MALSRELDAIELFFAGTGNYPCDVVEYKGHLDEASLARAFQFVCAKHPVLSSQLLGSTSGGLHLYIPETRFSQVKIVDGSDTELKRELLKRELRLLRDEQDVAARLIVSRDRGSGFVALAVNHALFDYPSFGVIFIELWEIYTQIVSRGTVTLEISAELPVSAELLIRNRWLKDHTLSAPDPGGYTRNVGRSRLNRIIEDTSLFDNAETQRLVDATRSHGISIHGLVCGGILLALRRHAVSVKSAQMACRSVVNLRDRVSQPVGSTETTVLQAMHRVDLTVSDSSSVVDLGTQIKEDLESSIACRDLQMIWQPGKRSLESELPARLAQILVTNVGILPTPQSPAGLNFVDRTIAGWLDGDRVSWIAVTPIYVVSTYRDRLKIIGLYPDDSFVDDEVKIISQDIVDNLLSAV